MLYYVILQNLKMYFLKRYLSIINNNLNMKTDMCNNKITKLKFFKLNDALNCEIESQNVFVLSCERMTYKNKIGRYYVIFPSFKHFLKNKHNYKHCHEIIVDHKNNVPNIGGRLVFDFDIKYTFIKVIPENFKLLIQKTIVDVINKYYTSVDSTKIQFIWSTSNNSHKFSKHLTVKNMYFTNWILMVRQFYNYFNIEWNTTQLWIHAEDLIDYQIVRKNGSLRMVGYSKINGSPLTFDNTDLNDIDSETYNNHFIDSLIRIYDTDTLLNEQKITPNNLKINYDLDKKTTELINPLTISTQTTVFTTKDLLNNNIYNLAFTLCDKVNPGIFSANKKYNSGISLLRKKPSKCILSGKLHESDNAYLIINKDTNEYTVYFGCYRNCGCKKTIKIGNITNNTIQEDTYLNTKIDKINNPNKLTSKKKIEMFSAIIG